MTDEDGRIERVRDVENIVKITGLAGGFLLCKNAYEIL